MEKSGETANRLNVKKPVKAMQSSRETKGSTHTPEFREHKKLFKTQSEKAGDVRLPKC